jgi:AcrR family transcriptional regulator
MQPKNVPQERASKMARRRTTAREGASSEYAARKQRILEAAALKFKEEAFDRADLSDMAADAGTERPNSCNYFENKEDLYPQVLHDRW